MKLKRILLYSAIGAFSVCTCACSKSGGTTKIDISFKEFDTTGVPNLKKFDYFTSDWTWSGSSAGTLDEKMFTVVPALNECKSQTLRTCFGMGEGYKGIGYNIGRNGKTGLTDAEYGPVLPVMKELEKNYVQPYMSVSYSPNCVINSGSWKSAPDPVKYKTFMSNVETVMERNGLNPVLEIYNEPDNSQFFSGKWSDYCDTYSAGYKGIKEVNKDRVVVGGSVAFMNIIADRYRTRPDMGGQSMDDVTYFFERCKNEDVTPDAFSWHYYGKGGEVTGIEKNGFDYYLNDYRRVLNAYQGTDYWNKLKYMGTHLNELNTYAPGGDDIYLTARVVPTMKNLMDLILNASDIDYAHFAALVGEKTDGLSYEAINGLSYERYCSYYFMWMYGHLPVWKNKVTIDDPDLAYYSGMDDGRCGTILINKTDKQKKISVNFKDFPFANMDATAYLSDDVHKTHTTSNVPYIYAQSKGVDATNGMNLELTLEPNGTVYFEFNNTDGTKTELDNYQTLGKFVRSDILHEERADNKPYANFMQNSLQTYIGMGNSDVGQIYQSTLMKDISKDSFVMDYQTNGEPAAFGGALGFQIDYRSNDGEFKKSVVYQMKDFTGKMSLPFSSDIDPTVVTFPHEEKGKVTVDLKQNAPTDWDHSVRITCFIKNTGANSSAKFRVI